MTSFLPVRPIEVTPETTPFWDATTDGKLVLPRCVQCGTTIWYPKAFCPACAASTVEWVPTSGNGTVYSFSITRKGAGVWSEHSPYVIAYVELEEGPRVLTNIVGCNVADVYIGMEVSVVFDATEEGPAVYRFQPPTGSSR
jgi:uncharacterized protein